MFYLVRESTADFADVWANLAHVYVEQKQYIISIQMYKSCLNRFYCHNNVKIMSCMARAYFKAGQLTEAKKVMLRARRVNPFDRVLIFNLAILLKEIALSVLKVQKSSFEDLLSVLKDMELVERYLEFMKKVNEKKLRYCATLEMESCQDMIAQVCIAILFYFNIIYFIVMSTGQVSFGKQREIQRRGTDQVQRRQRKTSVRARIT